MTVKSPPSPSHGDGYPAASTLTKERPSGSWLLANNPTLAFSSFLTNGSNDQPLVSTKPTPLNSSYSDVSTKSVMTRSSSTSQRTRHRSSIAQKLPQQQPGRSVSFDAEFPTLTSIPSTLTPSTAVTTTASSTHQHVWNNAQRIQHKVKSPAKTLWHGEDSDNEGEGNMMEIERLKALVPRRHSHQQTGATMAGYSPSAAAHRRKMSSTSTSKMPTTLSKKHRPPRHWTVTDRITTTIATTIKTTATSKQDDDASSSSSSSSSCSSILSPPAPLSPTNTSSSTAVEPASTSRQMNDVVVTKRDQLRFYLFLKKWTGNLIGDNVDPNGWQQQEQHDLSRPLPIGTQRYNSYTTSFYG